LASSFASLSSRFGVIGILLLAFIVTGGRRDFRGSASGSD
jgi:hypothetical protein